MRSSQEIRAAKYTDLFDLTGQIALVTGAARGLGRGIAERLAQCGATVVIADANKATGAAATESMREAGHAAEFAHVDLLDDGAVAGLVADSIGRHGRIDILVNNAGIYPYSPLIDMPTEQLDAVLGLDLRTPFLLCRDVARSMVDGGVRGRIVNVSSMNAYRAPFAGVAHYDAAKAGLVALTRSLAIELGPKGIRVNAIAPGLNLTEGQKEAFGLAPEDTEEAYPRFYKSWLARIPLGRVGHADDQARVVTFLVSDAAEYVTGQCFVVDGGAILV